jgi:flagellar assembly factor FliW
MMNISTLFFGELEVEEKDTITFIQGVPGFEDLTRYTRIQPERNIPFLYLQSLEKGELSFLVTNPFLFFKEYDFQLPELAQDELQIKQPEDVEVWSIVTVNEDYTKATVNLLAPIIVNSKNQTAKQVILNDTEYKVKHELVLIDANETNQTEG